VTHIDGLFFVGITSTGVLPAGVPRARFVSDRRRFFESPACRKARDSGRVFAAVELAPGPRSWTPYHVSRTWRHRMRQARSTTARSDNSLGILASVNGI
jgi:hypothetical protein